MKKVFKLEDLGCAHCAAKMEDAIKKLDGVIDVRINFITQKLIIETVDGVPEEIFKKAEKICRRIEPSCRIVY
jgi:copper chaperone CopZ